MLDKVEKQFLPLWTPLYKTSVDNLSGLLYNGKLIVRCRDNDKIRKYVALLNDGDEKYAFSEN